MRDTQASALTWVNTDADIIETTVRKYIDRHGLMAFMDAYYNLLGTRPEAVFTAENAELARVLGLAVNEAGLPLTVPRSEVLAQIYWPKLMLDRKFLARFFADRKILPELSELQRLFLEWHFLAPRDYAWSLFREPRQVLLGWNDVAELYGPQDFAMYTNLVGCTGVFALAEDGSTHMSHYDDDNINPAQIVALMDFRRRFPGSRIYVVGVHAEKFARTLYETRGIGDILIHVKEEYFGTGYWVGFARRNGHLHPTYCETPITKEYIPSAHNNDYGRWFVFGRFREIFPSADRDFVGTRFAAFQAPQKA